MLIRWIFSIQYFLFYLLLNRDQVNLTVKFMSRFLHPAEALLILISKPRNAVRGTTMAFALKGEVLNFKAIVSTFSLFCMSLFLFSGQAMELPTHDCSFRFYFHAALILWERLCPDTQMCTYLDLHDSWLLGLWYSCPDTLSVEISLQFYNRI